MVQSCFAKDVIRATKFFQESQSEPTHGVVMQPAKYSYIKQKRFEIYNTSNMCSIDWHSVESGENALHLEGSIHLHMLLQLPCILSCKVISSSAKYTCHPLKYTHHSSKLYKCNPLALMYNKPPLHPGHKDFN